MESIIRLGSVSLPALLLLFLAGCAGSNAPNEEQLPPGIQTPWGLIRGDASVGQKKARQLCSGCHKVEGVGNVLPGAPPFEQTVARDDVDKELLTRWLANPQAIKPGTLMPALGLSEADIEHLLAYLNNLRERQLSNTDR